MNFTTLTGAVDVLSTFAAILDPTQVPAAGTFRLLLDSSTVVAGAATQRLTQSPPTDIESWESGALSRVLRGLTIGAHNITLQWKIAEGTATLFCRAASFPDFEHAALRVMDIAP